MTGKWKIWALVFDSRVKEILQLTVLRLFIIGFFVCIVCVCCMCVTHTCECAGMYLEGRERYQVSSSTSPHFIILRQGLPLMWDLIVSASLSDQ